MTTGKRGLGEPLQVDELRGHNGYVDRISSGLTTGDVLRLMWKRSRMIFLIFGAVFIGMSVLFIPLDLGFALCMGGMFIFLMIIMIGTIGLTLLCTGKNQAKMLMENNYILLLRDRLVIQNQSDMGTPVLRNEIPLRKISDIENIPATYISDRRSKTNLCIRFFTGGYILPVGGLYPMAAKKEYLLAVHLNEPHEIHCYGRNPNGLYQMGDKREYVKEIVISADVGAHRRLISQIPFTVSKNTMPIQ